MKTEETLQLEKDQLQKENNQLQEQLAAVKAKYKKLSDKVLETLDCQQAYFKSNKDYQLLKKSKAVEAELREIIKPKPVSLASIDWLGQ